MSTAAPFFLRLLPLMTDLFRIGVWIWVLLALVPREAAAQIPGFTSSVSWKSERVAENHWRLTGAVEVERDDMKFYADEVDYYTDTNRLTAAGNVVFIQTDHRISADRADFDTRTRLGTFFNASGIATLGSQQDMAMFGTLEPDVYFYGKTLEKIGPDRYRITDGGFTTCVQPTPRWEITSGSVVLRLDHYAVLNHSLLRVKGLPVFYLPVLYYPINKSDRATGFLLPQYGRSTIKGRTFNNAFFWALGRSHDATFLHDWFSTTGFGVGGEYRYALAPGSQGNARTYFLNEHVATYETDGVEQVIPARKSYQVTGAATHVLNSHVTVRGRADYFSSIEVQQTYNTNVYDSSRNQRYVSGAVTGAWRTYALSGSYDRTEYFSGTTTSTLTGGAPRITASRAERLIPGTPVYVSVGGDYSHILRQVRQGGLPTDTGLDRGDATAVVRFPFTRWPFLTVASALGWRNTFWSDSLDEQGARVEAPIHRQYFDILAQVNGPIFNRIWDTPNNGYAQRFKHSIQPFFNLRRFTAIDNADRIVLLDAVDTVIGRMTRSTYGVNNRVYAKRTKDGAAAIAREIVSVAIQQSYYTDARAAKVDLLYRTSFSGTPPSHFSPVSLLVRAAPTAGIAAALRAEYDGRYRAWRSIGADGTVSGGDTVHATLGWSQRRYIPELPGFDDPSRLDHYFNGSTTLRLRQNRYGFVHSFNWDILRGALLQQRLAGYYNAQCCGFAAEYQMWDFTSLGSSAPVPKDRRFSFSFTLAGVGTFANFFGGLTGAVR